VLDDPEVADRGLVERVLLCSGKVYYDLRAEREKRGDFKTAIVRLEQLYPFPKERLRGVLGAYPAARRFVWVQEEPRNMGAWSFVAEREAEFLPANAALVYVGRAASPSPATGNAGVHKRETEKFVAEAFSA
jgi:2-oxoglutarate dehydrogenase complex dehydrogenase (E1) component-like enzyme